MAVEPEHLLTFAVVAKHGSISLAARELHRSQPAISVQMRLLSEAVGERLLRRERRGVELTEAGEGLLPYALAMKRALEGARRWRGDLESSALGSVAIAASMTVAVYVLPAVLASFHRANPHIALQLLTRNSLDALTLLERAGASVALVEGKVPPVPAGFHTRTLFDDEIVLAVQPSHPLARTTMVRPADLLGLEIVQREQGSGTREVVESALAALDLPAPGVRVALEATGIEAVKEAVIQGFGAGFISRLAIQREVTHGALVALPVEAHGFTRAITLISPEPELQSRGTRRMLQTLEGLAAVGER
jgi:DNA-binding transcriptional LysR family regulator